MRLPLASRVRLQTAAMLVLAITLPAFASPVISAHDRQEAGADRAREQIEQLRLQKQTADKEVLLRQGAAAVALQRVQELQKQLEEAQLRAHTETAQVQILQQQASEVENQLTELTATLPRHEAADSLVQTADKANARLTTLTSAQQQLREQLATLRKSSVEWRSKATDAEQQIAAITAQRPEQEKKVNEAKVAADAAETLLVAAQAAMTAAQTTVDSVTAALLLDEARVVSAKTSVDKLANSVASLEQSLTTLQVASKLASTDASAAIQGLEKAITDFAPLQVSTNALMTAVTTRRDEQAARLVAAKAELEKKTAENQTALTTAEPLRAALKTATDLIAAANAQEVPSASQ